MTVTETNQVRCFHEHQSGLFRVEYRADTGPVVVMGHFSHRESALDYLENLADELRHVGSLDEHSINHWRRQARRSGAVEPPKPAPAKLWQGDGDVTKQWDRGSGQVQGRDIDEKPQRRRSTHLGHIRPSHLRAALRVMIVISAWLLVVLSFVGTFYAVLGVPAPLTAPMQVWTDAQANWTALAIAVGLQGFLSLLQWGGRQQARDDHRWWLLYLGSLAVSALLNWEAYGSELIALDVPWLWAIAIVVGGDVAPEWILVKRE